MKTKKRILLFPLFLMMTLVILTTGCSEDEDDISGNGDTSGPTTGTVADVDGNTYDIVKIGNMWYMAENLKTTKYNDGTEINHYSVFEDEWQYASDGGYSYYENSPELLEKYGALYNWYTIETEKLCPDGWHVPTKEEYEQLFADVDYNQVNLRDTTTWGEHPVNGENYNGTNESGFAARAGGFRATSTTQGADENGFSSEGTYGKWWTSSSDSSCFQANCDYYRYYFEMLDMNYSKDLSSNRNINKIENDRIGYSVRCVTDDPGDLGK